jgi:long-chain acyl-CoA synthetase
MQKKGMMLKYDHNDSLLSYLPLANIFERIIHAVMTFWGARIGFYQGDILKLMEDLEILRPSIFPSVPELYKRIYDKVLAGVKAKGGGIVEKLFNAAYEAKKKGIKRGNTSHWLWDRLVFSKIKAKLGGNIRLMISGAAPIDPNMVEFLRICFSVTFVEGYGQTETTGAATLVS